MDFFNDDFTIEKYHTGLKEKQFSVSEAIKEFFSYAKKENEKIGAFLRFMEESELEKAKDLDKHLEEKGIDSELFAVPMGIKDNILIEGQLTTAASKILENYVASYDATVIKKLKSNHVVFLGKTNLDEFAMGSSTENSAFLITRNPKDISKVPGGSSGGSAAAVADNMVLGALGSDTGGSIRQPASFCGVVGLKPTYGAVSRYGVIALASSLDQIGPFAKTTKDVAKIFKVISGYDDLDSTSASQDYSDVDNFKDVDVKNLTIGIPKEYFVSGISPEVEKEIDQAIGRLRRDGFKIKEISLPHSKYALSCYYIILPAECSANLARYDGIRYSAPKELEGSDLSLLETYFKNRGMFIGDEPRRRILLGTFVLSSGYYDAYYAKAQKVRRLILNDFMKVFDKSTNEGVDVIMAPVTPSVAFGIGEKIDDPLSMYLSDIFTIPVNLAGLPALSVPTRKYDKGQLPVNFQLIGRHFDEKTILALGDYYESNLLNS
jgi:aspartyl-tRNA(Asn)/glutamyl-tRNA(Gln) amidotransferase subunit A